MPAVVQQVMAAGGKAERLIDRTLGTNIGDMTANGNLAAAFDGNANQAAAACAVKTASTIGWVGKTLAAPAVFNRALVSGSNDTGYSGYSNRTVSQTIYGKNGSAPGSSTDGTILGAISFSEGANESAPREIESNDKLTAWDHLWLRSFSGVGSPTSNPRVAELVLYELK